MVGMPNCHGPIGSLVMKFVLLRVHWALVPTKMFRVDVGSFEQLSAEVAHVCFADLADHMIAVVVILDKRASASWALANDCMRAYLTLTHLFFVTALAARRTIDRLPAIHTDHLITTGATVNRSFPDPIVVTVLAVNIFLAWLQGSLPHCRILPSDLKFFL
jgi:hypothetical protein